MLQSAPAPASRSNRKFKDASFFIQAAYNSYHLLPFRFHRLSAYREVLVNEMGDALTVATGTAARIIERKLDERDADLYADLLANFFISEQPISPMLDIMAARYRTKKSFLDQFTALHIFVISLRCEHTCHYCQVSRVTENKNDFDMRHEHIDKGIEIMMRSPNPFLTMEFQGGEALLAFDKIVYAVNKAREAAALHNKQINYVICTNLALITEEILFFCKENEILISSSLDGPGFIHNSNRRRPGKNSYELAIAGIEKSREILGHDRVSALLTTTTLSLDHPDEIVDEYFRMGFRNIFLRPISPYGFATHNPGKNAYDTSRFLRFYKKALERILQYNRQGHFFREDYAAILLQKILTPFTVGYVDLQSPAGMINSVIVFNYDGKVYATDESRMLAESGDQTFLLGNLDDDSYETIFSVSRIKDLPEVWNNESLAGCSECAFQPYCGADPVMHHATQGSMYGHRPTSSFCQRNMEIIRYLLEKMDNEPESKKIFLSWVTGKN